MYGSSRIILEPGYYEDGKFGIRIENVCVVKKADTQYCFDERGYLTFEHFTMVRTVITFQRVSDIYSYRIRRSSCSARFRPNLWTSSY